MGPASFRMLGGVNLSHLSTINHDYREKTALGSPQSGRSENVDLSTLGREWVKSEQLRAFVYIPSCECSFSDHNRSAVWRRLL